MNFCIIIPTRYNSSRFPGKVFVNILGKPMIQRVWERCIEVTNEVYIATPNDNIMQYCERSGIRSILTSINCKTGTDRIAEASEKLDKKYDIIINVQGDEPVILPEDILAIINSVSFKNKQISYCGMCKIKNEEDFRNPNIIKIVTTKSNNLLYASRAPIPTTKQKQFVNAYKQVCIYAFTPYILSIFRKFKKGKLEEIEDIEILRLLENRYNIKMVEVSDSSISVDVQEDVKKVEDFLRRNENV